MIRILTFLMVLQSIFDNSPVALAKPFVYPSYDDMVDLLHSYSSTHPRFSSLSTSQSSFSLPTVGTCGKTSTPCKNYFLTVNDHTNTINSELIPDIFLSGEVHGDETVGPSTVLYLSNLLTTASSCVLEHYTENGDKGANCVAWHNYGYTFADARWLSRLVKTRRVIISPASNALGFSQTRRAENGIDPNRDFAYDQNPSNCFRTIAGRHINEIFKNHLIQLSITFHGGMTAIAYEWGSPGHNTKNTVSPDNLAQKELTRGMSDYAGTFKGETKYPYNSMNKIVYPVNGGMEDWAYAGSWDTDYFVQCNPTTYGGYSQGEMGESLRAFNVLVEASRIKKPSESSLGRWEDVFTRENNGHVTRNIRLSLLTIDMAEPYVEVVRFGGQDFVDYDAMAGLGSGGGRNWATRGAGVSVEFKVHGCVTVDESIIVSVPAHVNSTLLWTLQEITPTTYNILVNGAILHENVAGAKVNGGKGRWAEPENGDGDVFEGTAGNIEGESSVVIFTRVDKSWGEEDRANFEPKNIGPQSHYVNARTNAEYEKVHAGKKVVGRIWWPSNPINVGAASKGGIGHVPDFEGETFKEKKGKGYDEKGNVDVGESQAVEFSMLWVMVGMLWVMVGCVLVAGAFMAVRKRRRRGGGRGGV
ncbi:hypothetical protein TL16_g00378 [Triparma laevis f. inornata]|uniref:Peptidase M14 domain-containing protein n=1 Tax=Triparma laevis f. inornata TaxID=1714386 RepID=A0A9W6ZCX1_9STRA|nr:hypothetical protein TL16_g00378 [Triparma laevis f. inornata]